MDPRVTLEDLVYFIDHAEWGHAVEALTRYYLWRLRGGFEPTFIMPTTVGGDAAAETLAQKLADAIDDERGLTRGF